MIFQLRTGCRQHLSASYIQELVAHLKENPCFDEVWLATSYGLPTVQECEKEAEAMKNAAEAFRSIGILPSMQVSRTLGHHPDSLLTYGDGGVQKSFEGITTIDGEKSDGVFCWNNADFTAYICAMLKAYAAWKPAIVWVDDDIRLRLMGKSKALCFCNTCIRLFNARQGTRYDRAALRHAFLCEDAVRRAYVDFQIETLAAFVGKFSAAIHEVSPDTVMGLQNGGNTMLAIRAQHACLQAMREATGHPPVFRAGGGFYDDHTPDGMFKKAMILHYMNDRLPDDISICSCEIENLPFTAYGKSPACTAIEAALYVAYGCNCASVTLMNESEPLCWHDRLLKILAAQKKGLEKVVSQNSNSKTGGIAIYQPPQSNFAAYGEDAPFFNETGILNFAHMLRLGLPIHAGVKGEAYLLSGAICDFLTSEDMNFLLRETVLLDGATLEKLQEVGLADLVGATAVPTPVGKIVYEKTTAYDDGGVTWPTGDVCMAITGEAMQEFCRFYARLDDTDCGCSLAVVQTALGGRWVVSGISLQYPNINFRHREALRRAVAVACGRDLPAYVATPDQTVVIPRVNEKGETVSVTLIEACLTDAEDLEVAIEHPQNPQGYILIFSDGRSVSGTYRRRDGKTVAVVPSLPAWHVVTLLT